MKIYTKTGDSGKTSLLEGTRLSKAHERIEAYGTVDELNSFIGLLADQEAGIPYRLFLKRIQDRLFVIGANLASDPSKTAEKVPPVKDSDIQLLETAMDEMDAQLPPLRHFILPGGHQAVSLAHVARTICRRAERGVIRLAEHEEVPGQIVPFLNRLSDYFFILSRKICHDLGLEEHTWQAEKSGT